MMVVMGCDVGSARRGVGFDGIRVGKHVQLALRAEGLMVRPEINA